MNNKGLKAGSLLLGIAAFLFLVSLAVTVTLNFRPLYYLDMRLLDIPGNSGYSEELVRQNYNILIDYNNITYDGELCFVGMPMSETARIHFEEVKAVFAVFEWMLPVTGLMLLAGALFFCRKREYGFLKTAAVSGAAVPAVLACLLAGDWESLFLAFHELVFSNDYWLFDPAADPVILILPDAYFMHCAVMIIGLILAGSLICFGLYRVLT